MGSALKDMDKGDKVGRDRNAVVTGPNGESRVTDAWLTEEGGFHGQLGWAFGFERAGNG